MSQLWKLAHERALNETREALKLTELAPFHMVGALNPA